MKTTFREKSYYWYWKWQRRLVPGLQPSQYEFADTLTRTLTMNRSWLDVGCGRRPLPAWVPEFRQVDILTRTVDAVGTDLDLDSLKDHRILRKRVQASADSLPFSDHSFDVVSANMVMEHVADPDSVLRELRRVLKPGGVFIFHTPNRRYWAIALASVMPDFAKTLFADFLEGRRSEDVFPTRYRFNDPEQILTIAAAAGFNVERLDMVSSSAVLAGAGPLVLPELWLIRMLRRDALARWRSNIIGTLRAQV